MLQVKTLYRGPRPGLQETKASGNPHSVNSHSNSREKGSVAGARALEIQSVNYRGGVPLSL
jgi:hypothetical protein